MKITLKQSKDYERETEELMRSMEKFRKTAKNVSGKTSLEILREFRYPKKYKKLG